MAPQSAALRPPPTSACQPWQGGGPRSTSGSSEVLSSPDLHSHPRPAAQVWVPPRGTNSCPSSETQAQCQELQTQNNMSQDGVLVTCASAPTSISVRTCQEGGTGLFPLGPPHNQPLALYPQGTSSLHGNPPWQLLNSGILPPRPLLISLQTPRMFLWLLG